MPQVITFEDFIPSPRFDGIPWTEARIEEAATPAGPWAQIDVIALVPVDPDPANPMIRNFTTQLAGAGELWYRIIFADASGDVLEPTTPIQNTAGSAVDTGPNWISGLDVAACCNAEDASDATVFESAAEVSSQLLFQYSGRQFPGILQRTVRPCRTTCACPWQVLSRGHIVWNPNIINPWAGYGMWWWNGDSCGCQPLSRVLLAGYVQSIVEVLIDGAVVPADTYRVDQHRWLCRVQPTASDSWPHWPGCQNMSLPETEDGTWAVTYTYGKAPPISGVNAAVELACEIYKQCAGETCRLPQNTTRVARQGIVIERPAFFAWAFEKGGRSIPRGWKTGLPQVDAFLNAWNPTGLVRQPVVWTPTSYLRYAPAVGL